MRMPRSVDDVIHSAVYDPAKRHQQYLRTRQLKGRRNGVGPPKAGLGSRIVDANAPGSTVHVSKARMDAAARQAASNARQIAQIKGRLNTLRAHLKELLAKQKASSSSSSKSSTSSSSKTDEGTKGTSKPKTAAQKAAAKKSLAKAQQARAQQQKAEPDQKETKTPVSLTEQIATTRAVISQVETKLRTAIEQARTQTASNGR